jgi:hypothetical protein
MASSIASSWKGRSGTSASSANVPASVMPATVIALEAAGVATAIASLRRRRRASSRMEPAMNTL